MTFTKKISRRLDKKKEQLLWKYRELEYRSYADPRSLHWDWTTTSYNRLSLVNSLVHLRGGGSCDYLEIGCFQDTLFNAVFACNKVGVDPQQGGTLRLTSDEFFRDNQEAFDVIFIDGLHEYEQVRKDAVNALQCLKPGGFIAFHDMLPRHWKEQHVPRLNEEWTGDVWKLAFELAESPDLDFRIVSIDYGVGVLRVNSPSPQLVDRQSELTSATFGYFYENHHKLPLLSWEEFTKWADLCGEPS
jgi:SAM-dependent methyltransferase